MISCVLSKPRSARSAASAPFAAALPAWNDLHMVPRFCCMPAAWVAAIPMT
jgi:hypothetical protein